MKQRVFAVFVINILLFSSFLISLSSTSASNNTHSVLAYSTNLSMRALKKGDLVFCDVKPIISRISTNIGKGRLQSTGGYSDDHVLMYIGNNKFIESCPYFYNPLKSDWIGVIITPLIILKTWATNFTYGRVDTTQENKNDAISWAKTQLGKPYGEEGYYCAELISKAYNDTGINITYTDWHGDTNIAWGPEQLKNADIVKMLSPNIAPTAKIHLEDINDFYVYLNGYNSEDLDGGIREFLWNMGDGTTSSKPYVIHQYQKSGEYKITLTVTDYYGDSDTAEMFVIIE